MVRLAFGAEADLDLHVTDPLQETLYFAERSVRSGGRLEADLRCAAPAPRIEVVRFAEPRPGRYRVGVDFMRRCDDGVRAAPWVMSIDALGERRFLRGLAEWGPSGGAFSPRVEEFSHP